MEENNPSVPESTPSSDDTKNRALLPVDLIQPRWEMMGPQERAFATCLLECVQLEYLIRKNLPICEEVVTPQNSSDTGEEIKTEDLSEHEENDPDSANLTPDIISPVKYSMGRIAWEFATYPDYADLLNGLNIRYHFVKMVKFRNYLIHRVDTGQYVSAKLRKRYIILSRMVYFLKRWPHLVSVYYIIHKLVSDWYFQSGLFGPPPPVSMMLKSRRKGNPLPFSLGLSQEDEETLNQTLDAIVLTDPVHSADEIIELGLQVSKIQFGNVSI
jgi:hypothetical protein